MKVSARPYPSNSLFIELAGNSIYFGSINYERIFLHKNYFYLSGRIGVGYGKFMSNSIFSTPLFINGIFQIYHAVAVELGIGVQFETIGIQEEDFSFKQSWKYSSGVIPVGMVGLRIQCKNGFLLRTTFTPTYLFRNDESNNKSIVLFPWFGVSLGGSFGKNKK